MRRETPAHPGFTQIMRPWGQETVCVSVSAADSRELPSEHPAPVSTSCARSCAISVRSSLCHHECLHHSLKG